MADKDSVQNRRKREVDGLYYISHADNLQSILQQGILSHRQVLDRGLPYAPAYDVDIVG